MLLAVLCLRKPTLLPAVDVLLPKGAFLFGCHGIALKYCEGAG